MKKSIVNIVKQHLALQGRKMKLTGEKMNGKPCYSVTGWSGHYTIDGIIWQLGL
jgi:hypothetical protein